MAEIEAEGLSERENHTCIFEFHVPLVPDPRRVEFDPLWEWGQSVEEFQKAHRPGGGKKQWLAAWARVMELRRRQIEAALAHARAASSREELEVALERADRTLAVLLRWQEESQ